MAASRSRRANAGCRMKEVMEKGDNDPFYASLYGGFYDDEDDTDYKCSYKAKKTQPAADDDQATGSKEDEDLGSESEGSDSEGSEEEEEEEEEEGNKEDHKENGQNEEGLKNDEVDDKLDNLESPAKKRKVET